MDGRTPATLEPMVTPLDAARLATVGVSDVRPSDVAPHPALEFSFRSRTYRLEHQHAGISTLVDVAAGDVPLCRFEYSSSLSTMRFQLAGWPSGSPRLPPRHAVAYMTAIQIAAQDDTAFELFHQQ